MNTLKNTMNNDTTGLPRGVETKIVEQPSLAPQTVVPEGKDLPTAIKILESNLNDSDIKTYMGLKFLHSGEQFPKNPQILFDKVGKILFTNATKVKDGEVRDSNELLLELLALFTTHYNQTN